MIEAIKEIGEYALKNNELNQDNFLNNICIKLPKEKSIKRNDETRQFQQFVVFLNFDIKDKKIKIDREEVNCENVKGDSGKEYLWVGNFLGNKPKVNITSDTLKYILTMTLPEIKNRVDKVEGQFKENLEEVISIFFNEKKNKDYSIRPETFDFFDKKLEEIKESGNQIKAKLKEINTEKEAEEQIKKLKELWKDGTGDTLEIDNKGDLKEVKQKIQYKCDELLNEIEDKLKEKYKVVGKLTYDLLESMNLSSDNISIYTIKINDNLVCQTKEYKNMLYYEKICCLFDERNKNYKNNLNSQGVCSICSDDASTKKQTTSNTTNLEFKFYMTDKIGFSFGLDKTFKKNLNLCKDCYQYLMIGERFIRNNLKTRIGGLDVYIIPQFAFKDPKMDIEEFSDYVSSHTNSITKNIGKFEDKLEEYAKYDKNIFAINYLFYHQPPGSSEFKVLKLIKDIPPTRLYFIRKKEEDLINLIDEKYAEMDKFKICLDTIWGCIPLKQEKKEKGFYQGVSRYLDVLDAIFSNGKIDYCSLINQFIEVIRIIKFERVGYNIRTKEEDLADKILQLNFLLLFFKKLNILNITNKMENVNDHETDELIPPEILSYWEDVEIYEDKCKRALFLLGYLIGEIGYKQDKKDIKNRPILNKITFQGMDVEKLKRLSNDIFEKLRQYDVRKYNEEIHSAFKKLFEEHINNWNLSNQENVFYVLSGYAFSGYVGFQRYKKGIEDDIKKKQEEIQEAKAIKKDVTAQEKQLEEAIKMFNSKEKDSYKKTKEILKNIKI